MSSTVSTLQDFPWNESAQAVKDSLRFDSYPVFMEHVFDTLPQNSPQTRRRYTDLKRREPSPRYRHYFEILPPELQDPAFLDRIHAFLPGWEMPKVRPENYATGYGFITDYLAEIFTRLRRHNYQTHVAAHVDFGKMTGRNQDAVKKITAGLLKLVFPHRTAEDLRQDELEMCLALATECRQRVLDQLGVMLPEEFGGTKVEVQMQG